ncbi:MAG: hypothetical protein CMH52_03000 [Myxococcales bacterium]|nr:hypothetical protein [Myxococcales bacterium]|tara:strand:+ start:2452 stop:4023 length:1572 start_codon:yes stop_codon:yes gene_type:complete
MASTGTLFDKDSTRIEEILSKQIDTILPTMDPIWRDTVVTSQGVGNASEFSKDFQVNKLYRTGMTGVIDQAAPVGDFPLFGDQVGTTIGARLLQNTAAKTFPDALEGAKPKALRLTVPMRAMYTNLALTLGEMQMDATPAVVGDVIAPVLQGFAQNLSHTLCNYWYVSQADKYKLGTISGTPTNSGSGPYYSKVSILENTYDRFFAGQRIDIYDESEDSGNGLRSNSISGGARYAVFVDSVDDLKGELTLVSAVNVFAGGVTGSVAIADGDALMYANSGEDEAGNGPTNTSASFTGIAGINSWLKNTGDLLGSEAVGTANEGKISVADHPEFKSFFKGSVGVLTEHKLRQYLRRFHAAKAKLGQTIDSLVASDGVWLSYEAQKIGQYQIERSGNLSNMNSQGSEEGFAFTFEGRTYKGNTSQYVEDGSVYGIKTSGQNWKRYSPPDYAGLQAMGEAPAHVPFRFVAPALTGGTSAKFPYLTGGAGGALTEVVQMPGMLRMQLIPDQPAGMKLTGVTTDTEYGD